MTIKEIIDATANVVGRKDVSEYLNLGKEGSEDTLLTVNKLVGLLNMIISELAGTFIPMIKSESVSAKNGRIYFTDLSCKALEILKVLLPNGTELNYSQNAEFISVPADNVIIEYSYVPPAYDLTSTIGYTEKEISKSTLIYGLCAEYCICTGAFDEAVLWHDRYVDAVKETRKVKNSKIKGRCWA